MVISILQLLQFVKKFLSIDSWYENPTAIVFLISDLQQQNVVSLTSCNSIQLICNKRATNVSSCSEEGFNIHSVHRGINSPPPSQKYRPLSFQVPPYIGKLSKPPPLFRRTPLLYWFFVTPPSLKVQWTPKILTFFILNTIFSFKSN